MLSKVEFLLIFNVILLYIFVFHAFYGLNVAKKRYLERCKGQEQAWRSASICVMTKNIFANYFTENERQRKKNDIFLPEEKGRKLRYHKIIKVLNNLVIRTIFLLKKGK